MKGVLFVEKVAYQGFRNAAMLFALTVALMVSGCLGGSDQGQLAVLTITADADSAVFGETIALQAVGASSNGRALHVSPEWTIVKGSGSLSGDANQATFLAADRQYSGEVEIAAQVGSITQRITIDVMGCLMGSKNQLIPDPDWGSSGSRLPSRSFWSEITTKPLDAYRMDRQWSWYGTPLDPMPTTYMLDGGLTNPRDVDPIRKYDRAFLSRLTYTDTSIPDGKLPNELYLSHYFYYEKLAEYNLPGEGITSAYSLSAKEGVSTTNATEIVRSTYKELKGDAFWSWGAVSAKWSETVTSRDFSSVTIQKETTTTHNFAYTPNQPTVFTVWQKVDVFFVSDDQGNPVNQSDVFSAYKLNSFETEVRSNEFEIITWPHP